ncbi:MAG: sulfotransferase [Acidimicrobiia bacterium]|nr:sulfotransferase [Acidimicrobiia bacterium]MDH4309774.1 sulfotransferase [Acidimicrobiia bacterium]
MSGPIYVAGLERSGTSLIFALLASHPNIAMTRRTNLWTHFYDQYGDLSDDANLDACLDMMKRYQRLVKLEPDWDRLRADFVAGSRTYGRLFDLIERQQADRMAKPRWGDKSLNTERYARPIYEAFDDARIIHMVRDPRDRYASSKTRWKRRRGGVGAGIAEWLASVRLAADNTERYGSRYLVLRYEDLVRDPEGSLRRVCECIEEPYSEDMLTMRGAAEFRDQGANSSYGSRASGEISTESIGKYRQVLPPTQVSFVDRVAATEMAKLGYQTDARKLSAVDRLRYWLGTVPAERVRMTLWHMRTGLLDRKGRPVPAYRIVESEPA